MTGPQDSLTIPAEWAPHRAIWTAWPSHPELWQDNLAGARREVAAMVRALAPDDRVIVLARGDEALSSAREALGAAAEILPAEFGDIWLRDTGPIFALSGGECVALRFANNGWGGKYILPGDDRVGDVVAGSAGAAVRRFDFVLEGGALEHNGQGWVLTTRQCLLNPNRNADWDEATAAAELGRSLHCSRLLWLDEGLQNDHTDGHVDNLARFVGADRVVCQIPSGSDDPNAAVYREIETRLRETGLTVHRIPSPGLVVDGDGSPMAASHMNFIIGNASVVVPVYDDRYGEEAVSGLQALFPGRRVLGLPSRHLLTGGGSFHCITQQQPAGEEQGAATGGSTA